MPFRLIRLLIKDNAETIRPLCVYNNFPQLARSIYKLTK